VPYLAVPHGAFADRVEVWVAALNEPELPAVLVVGGIAHPVPAAWQRWTSPDGSLHLRHQRVTIGGLAARQRYGVELRVGAVLQGVCKAATLPSALPVASERWPLTVMLGSCFCRLKDEQGDAGRRYVQIPGGRRPDLNILCGDQVYLDSPWPRFLAPIRRDTLTRTLLDNYWKTWSHEGGFQEILRQGPNWFLGDDHEFWNNAPNRSFPFNSLMPGPRAYWLQLARTLYQAFQSPTSTARISVPPLSFFFADTRINREPGRTRFMAPADLAALGAWIDGLQAPGVLVIGQPVFAEPGTFKERLGDLGLPDYEQYADLVEVLFRARHSVVVLTGDVHFGRVSRCSLPSGGELIEVISSPLALVDKGAGEKWHPAPDRFPAADLGVTPVPIETHGQPQEWRDHFITLELEKVGGEVSLQVHFWPIDGLERLSVFSDGLH
jgi:hypothetical protein